MLGKNAWEKTAKRIMVAIEFTTRGQSPMRASICFAAITVVLLNKIKEKIQFDYGKGKHSFQFEAKVKYSYLNIPLEGVLDKVI